MEAGNIFGREMAARKAQKKGEKRPLLFILFSLYWVKGEECYEGWREGGKQRLMWFKA